MKASVIIPVYNAEKYISETLDSALDQNISKNNYEIVIVNDGSTDKTEKKIFPYLNNKNVRYFKQINRGGPSALNTGIENSRSDLIMLLDADDLYFPNTVKTCVDFMNNNSEVDFMYSQHVRIDEKGKPIKLRKGFDFNLDKLLHFNFVGHVKGFKKYVFDRLEGFDESIKVANDYDFTLRAASDGFFFGRIPEVLYKYRIHGENKSITLEKESIKNVEKMITKTLEKLGRDNVTSEYYKKVNNYHYYKHELK
tara:strand:+ start:465 stop:1223 length:759 start_codon:yes stop_codon:yes gene_type:complete